MLASGVVSESQCMLSKVSYIFDSGLESRQKRHKNTHSNRPSIPFIPLAIHLTLLYSTYRHTHSILFHLLVAFLHLLFHSLIILTHSLAPRPSYPLPHLQIHTLNSLSSPRCISTTPTQLFSSCFISTSTISFPSYPDTLPSHPSPPTLQPPAVNTPLC